MTILIYGLSGMQLLALTSLTQKAGIVCRPVSDAMTYLTIGQLLSGKEFPDRPSAPLIGKFALLDGFDGRESIGTNLINQTAPGVIKAIHTKHNDNWHFSELCAAISEEHRALGGK